MQVAEDQFPLALMFVRNTSMIIYLYVKQHTITGLKYFGKTTEIDPFKYRGSGRHWTRHLKKHGNSIKTLDIWGFDDIKLCSEFAIQFSTKNNIVESKEWANEIPENGITGWPKGAKRGEQTAEHRVKNSAKNAGSLNAMYGVSRGADHMRSVGKIGISKQKILRSTDPEWAEREKQKWYKSWESLDRMIAHKARFSGKSPAVNAITREKLGLVDCNDPRWKTGEICSPQKGVKKKRLEK